LTWATPDGVTVSFRDGLLTATRGIGDDLMSTDLSSVLPAYRGQTSQAIRVMRWLGGEDQLVLRSFVCDFTRRSGVAIRAIAGAFRTTQITESCIGEDGFTFTNQYWVEQNSVLRMSQQWVGPGVGYMLTEVVKAQ